MSKALGASGRGVWSRSSKCSAGYSRKSPKRKHFVFKTITRYHQSKKLFRSSRELGRAVPQYCAPDAHRGRRCSNDLMRSPVGRVAILAHSVPARVRCFRPLQIAAAISNSKKTASRPISHLSSQTGVQCITDNTHHGILPVRPEVDVRISVQNIGQAPASHLYQRRPHIDQHHIVRK